MKSFLEQNGIFAEKDWDSSDESYYDEEEDYGRKIRKRFLTAKIQTWPFEKIVCSSIFYTLSREIETDGYIYPLTFTDVIPHSTSSVVGPELLAVIKRNYFFKLDPAKAIKDTSYFFHNN